MDVFIAGCSDPNALDQQEQLKSQTNIAANLSQYKIRDLGVLGDDDRDFSYAFSINNNGQIVGQSTGPFGSWSIRAFLWENGRMNDLGPNYSLKSSASSINDKGQIVGYSTPEGLLDEIHAFLWENDKKSDM